MRYYVELEGQEHRVEIDEDGVSLDGCALDARLRRIGTGLWHLLLDGRSYTFHTRRLEERGHWLVGLGGRRLEAVVLDERRRAIRRLAGIGGAALGPLVVTAPMPGLVIAVEVSQGDAVEEGDGLAVIEAMKMENELKARATGRVREVRVSVGQAVNKGDTLLILDPEGGGEE